MSFVLNGDLKWRVLSYTGYFRAFFVLRGSEFQFRPSAVSLYPNMGKCPPPSPEVVASVKGESVVFHASVNPNPGWRTGDAPHEFRIQCSHAKKEKTLHRVRERKGRVSACFLWGCAARFSKL